MTPSEALHTAARRYCIEQARHWRQRYADLCARRGERLTSRAGQWSYSDAAYDLFPRYNVLGAILTEVERLAPVDLGRFEQAREMIALAGEVAGNATTRGDHPIERAAMEQERAKFVAWVRSFTPEQLSKVEPLPYRRVLDNREAARLDDQIEQRWGAWEGGASDKLDLPEHLVLQASKVDDARLGQLREILRGRRVERLFEVREWGDSYEIDLELAEFQYTGAEGYWCEPGARWMINASHEDSLTIGGGWLVAEVQRCWPDWKDLRYRGYDGQLVPVQ